MSEPCELVTAIAVVSSSTPATDVIVVARNTVVVSSTVVPVTTPAALINKGLGISEAIADRYTPVIERAVASSSVYANSMPYLVTGDKALGRSLVRAQFEDLCLASATASSTALPPPIEELVIASAVASTTLTLGTGAAKVLSDKGKASSSTQLGYSDLLTGSATVASTVEGSRYVSVFSTDAVTAADEVFASTLPKDFIAVSKGLGTDSAELTLSASNIVISRGLSTSGAWFKDPARIAWVMNSETTAASWYTNFDFESIVQTEDKVLAVGPDGIYEVTGTSDSGESIDAKLVSGLLDFSTTTTKRVENMYFGYTSDERIAVTVETPDSGHPPGTYFLERSSATAPRNSRVSPGKGLYGRYWRVTVSNTQGGEFEVHDASVDVAESSRRI